MSKRKRKDVPVSESTYLREIDELSKDISRLEKESELQERHSAQRFSNKCLEKIVESLPSSEIATSSTRNSKGRRSNREEEFKSLLTRKGKLETLTGLQFEDDKVELISSVDDINNNNANVKEWRRVLKGKCLDLSFMVDFETEEKVETSGEGEQEQSVAKTTKLAITINDPIAKEELETFVATAEQEQSLSTALIVLQRYARCHSCRQRTFKHFNAKYPEFICFLCAPEQSSFMEIRNRQRHGLHFNVCWEIHIDKFGQVVPQIDAFVCSTVDVDGANEVMNSTPEYFRKILSRCGIEEAIELIISIVKE
ncbi:hypothetical protein QZH41_014924 [Actinostola sp. cb2023]|nr:hypothetical protein QZH41_014924 [Actinostola sp. cb2023]